MYSELQFKFKWLKFNTFKYLRSKVNYVEYIQHFQKIQHMHGRNQNVKTIRGFPTIRCNRIFFFLKKISFLEKTLLKKGLTRLKSAYEMVGSYFHETSSHRLIFIL
jgi:hypothetical protein